MPSIEIIQAMALSIACSSLFHQMTIRCCKELTDALLPSSNQPPINLNRPLDPWETSPHPRLETGRPVNAQMMRLIWIRSNMIISDDPFVNQDGSMLLSGCKTSRAEETDQRRMRSDTMIESAYTYPSELTWRSRTTLWRPVSSPSSRRPRLRDDAPPARRGFCDRWPIRSTKLLPAPSSLCPAPSWTPSNL